MSNTIKRKKTPYWLYILLILLSLAIIWFCAGIGLGTWQNPFALSDVLLSLRLPRVGVALMVGLALAVSGAALQALFENPLADPSLIGTSGGAALGVVLVLTMGFQGIGVPLAAFSGSLAVCLFVLMTHKFFGGGRMGLLIMGFIISAFCGAVVSLILFMSNDLVLRSAMNWLAGSMAEAGFVSPYYALGSLILGLMILIPMGRQLDALMLGEETAISMGIRVFRARAITVVGAALLTGAAVSLSGVIGFVGMMIPNILAVTMGGTRTRLMILSAWAGAMFLLIVDSTARNFTYPIDLPVGIVISLLGGPFFMWLFLRSARGSR